MADWSLDGEGRRIVIRRGAVDQLIHSFWEERDRFGLWLPVLLASGIVLYFLLPSEPRPWAGSAGLGLALALACVGRRDWFVLWPCVCAGVVALGFALAQWETARVTAPVLERALGPVMVEGRVIVLERRPEGPRVTLDRLAAGAFRSGPVPARVRIALRGEAAEAPLPGSRIAVLARLNPPPSPSMPGGYDFQRRAWFDRLGGVGFALGDVRTISLAGQDGADVSGWTDRALITIARIRDAMSERIRSAIPKEAGAVSAALVTGDRSAIPENVLQAMRDSGLAHLLAISGLHVGLVAMILFGGLRGLMALVPWLALRVPIKKWAAGAAIIGAVIYMGLAGATVPTQRAVLMTAIALGAVMLDRSPFSLRLVAVAAIVVLAIQPEELMGPSFQLSFAAVTALVAFYEALGPTLRRWHRAAGPVGRVGLYLAGIAMTTLVAGAATGLIGAYHFNRHADYSLAANLLAIPLTAFWIMPAAVLAVLLMPFGLEALPLIVMGWGVDALLLVAATVSSWPGAVTYLPQMPDWGLAAAVLGGAWLCLWKGRKRLIGLAGPVAALVSLTLVTPPDLLVSDSGRLIGLRSGEGVLFLSSPRRERHSAEMWAEMLGEPARDAFPRAGDAALDGRLRCDASGCVLRGQGIMVAMPWRTESLVQDCRRADLIVTALRAPRDCGATGAAGNGVIDARALQAHGAIFVWFEPDGTMRTQTVRDRRGIRPWTGSHRVAPGAG